MSLIGVGVGLVAVVITYVTGRRHGRRSLRTTAGRQRAGMARETHPETAPARAIPPVGYGRRRGDVPALPRQLDRLMEPVTAEIEMQPPATTRIRAVRR